jgi:hypothetical protein
MPKVKKMNGEGIVEDAKSVVKRLGKEAVDVALPIAKELATKMIKDAIKKKMGDGLYAANVNMGRGIHMKMSAAQLRSIKKGGAIQLNSDMLDEAGRFAMELKPEAMALLEKALSKSKGMRVTRDHMVDLMDMKKGGSVLTEVGKIVAPMVAQKMLEMGLTNIGGDILEEKFSINDIGRTGKRLFGMGKHGMGKHGMGKHGMGKHGGDILEEKFSINDIGRTGKRLFGMGKPFTKKQLTQIILDKNKVIGDLEKTAYGKGLFVGGKMGMGLSESSTLQTGLSYDNANVQGMNPFKEVRNPYG